MLRLGVIISAPSILLFVVVAASAADASAADALPKTPETFEVDGHKALVYAAPQPAAGKPWVWYAPTIKGMSLVIRRAYFEGFLNAGISIAGFDLGEVRGSPQSTAEFHKFYEEMVRRGWSARPILLGQSRGGLMMLAWAVRHPENVQAFVGIYPVCSLAQWPLRGLETTLADYQLGEEAFRAKLKELNPLEHVERLAEQQVPMFVVHGDSDTAVTFEDNTALLKQRYEAAGGSIAVKVIPGEGHQATPSFFECPELLAFVLEQAKSP